MSKPLYNNLIETESFEDVLSHLTQETLVICDIDNTLIEPDQHLGSVHWGENLIRNLIASGKSPEVAEQTIHELWLIILPNVNMRLIDKEAPSILHKISKEGHTVLGLTARHPSESYFTHPQLDQVGICFDTLNSKNYQAPMLKLPVTYEKGVIFCGTYQKKSDVLVSFLQKNNYKPKKIIFIDDKWSHINDVDEALALLNIDYVGVRFSKADQRIKEYHATIADIQWKSFPRIITDKEAHELLMHVK